MNEPAVSLDEPSRAADLLANEGTWQNPLRLVTMTVAATLLMILAAIAAWRFYADGQLGRVELTNAGPPLTAQVLPESGDTPLGEPFDVVTRKTLALPDGDYRLRVNGPGRLGQTYRFAVNRGETETHELTLDQGLLLGGERVFLGGNHQKRPRLEPIPFSPTTVALELTPGKADLVEWRRGTVIRRDGVTGQTVWDIARPEKLFDPGHDPAPWITSTTGENQQAAIVEPAPDLDGDGTGDLVWPLREIPVIVAISGKDGSLLWTYAAELDGPGGPQPEGPTYAGRGKLSRRDGRIVGVPRTADADRDGTPDLIATVHFSETPLETNRRTANAPRRGPAAAAVQQTFARRTIVAISGRSGRWLWSYPIDRTFTARSLPTWLRPATLARGRGLASIGYVDETRWIHLDPATGQPRGDPIDLGFVPVRPVQYADLDGDGEPEVLAMGPGQPPQRQTLAAFSSRTGRPLWVEPIPVRAPYPWRDEMAIPPDWPLAVDLDGDGLSEVVIPGSGPLARGSGYRGLRMLDGLTGRTRWTRPMRPETKVEDGLAHVIDAPDLDGDGTRDLVAISQFNGRQPISPASGKPSEPVRLYVDAISGKTGRLLWWWHADLARGRFTRIWTPRWWGRGPDGWPLLVVGFGGPYRWGFDSNMRPSMLQPPSVHLLEASTGRDLHQIDGLIEPRAADLDGDGLADLWGECEGELRAFRGEPPAAWRTLGFYLPASEGLSVTDRGAAVSQPGTDLDGDGVPDTLIGNLRAPGDPASQEMGSRTVIARSGHDGRVLWKTRLDPRQGWDAQNRAEFYRMQAYPLPAGDLDGDGTADVIVTRSEPTGTQGKHRAATLPLDALSGRNGRHLWSAGPLPLGFVAHGNSGIDWVEIRAVEPRGTPDLLVRHSDQFLAPGSPPPPRSGLQQARLARISARDGRILWDTLLLANAQPRSEMGPPYPGFGDLDGDGSLDLVMAVGSPQRFDHTYDAIAVSLRDGKILWSRPLNARYPWLVVADLDGDHRAEILVDDTSARSGNASVLAALDGRDGKSRWTWQSNAVESRRPWVARWNALADFAGDGRRRICLILSQARGPHRLVVLDDQGQETARRDLPRKQADRPNAVDLDGDGRDELLLLFGQVLHAWGHDLNELWSWPLSGWSSPNYEIVPTSRGRGEMSAVLLHPDLLALDAATGQPRWRGQAPVHRDLPYQTRLLDCGDSARPPLLVTRLQGPGTTACRQALPTTTKGSPEPPRGTPVPPGLSRDRDRDDPRWTRPLPWSHVFNHEAGKTGWLAATGLALFNVVLPLGLLRLAARRRPWTLRLVMALPVAAAIPLTAFVALEPRIPTFPVPYAVSSRVLFTVGTLAGIPFVAFAAIMGWCLIRRQGKRLALLAGLTVLATLATAAAWLWLDMRTMPAIEHYDGSGWYLAVLPGAYAVGLLMLAAWPIRKIVLWRLS